MTRRRKSSLRTMITAVIGFCCLLGVIGAVLQSTPEGRARRHATETARALALSFTPIDTARPESTKTPRPTATTRPTSTARPTATKPPATSSGGGGNSFDSNHDGRITCDDFQTRAQAQRAYKAGYTNLDGSDNDGKACENLP